MALDLTVYPDTPIERLPRALRFPALLVRNLIFAFTRPHRPPPQDEYVYEADGLATVHFSPFLHDRRYAQLYEEMASDWYVGLDADVRWRMWILTSLAKECRTLPGSYVEFGVYRAGCAFMMLSTSDVPSEKRIYMFDTFAGIPGEGLTHSEVETGLAGALANTSLDYVRQRLAPWLSQLVLVEGDVFETLQATETGPLAFVHMDLNASAPTLRALEYSYPRMEAGAIMVFDDYGEKGLESQRAAVDEFLADKPESVVALPTRQGVLLKR